MSPRVVRTVLALCASWLFLASVPVSAHHSFAMFDFAKQVTISGAIKEFQWTNPHVIVWVDADPTGGEVAATWSLELTSPGNLTRGGWDRHALTAGDKVSIDLNPLRNGNHGGALINVRNLTTGKTFTTNLRDVERPGLK